MKNALILALGGVGVMGVIVACTVVLLKGPAQEPASLQGVSVPQEQQPFAENPSPEPYLLRTFEGKLGVFTEDLVKPDYVLEVYVKTLPEADRAALEKGVRASDYESLSKMIEDYIS